MSTTRWTRGSIRRGSALGALLLVPFLLLAPPGCVPEGETDGGGGGLIPDAGNPDVHRPPDASSLWPPDIVEEGDSFEATPDGGRFTLLDGEVEIELPPETVKQNTEISVRRRLLNVRGEDLVGYVWGPHMPLPDGASIRVTVPTSWAIGEARDALLAFIDVEPGELLHGGTTTVEGQDLVIEADIDRLADMVIGEAWVF